MDATVCSECGSTYTEDRCPQCVYDPEMMKLVGLRQSVDMALIETQKLMNNVTDALVGLEALLQIISNKLRAREDG